jgi:hypothetical protein
MNFGEVETPIRVPASRNVQKAGSVALGNEIFRNGQPEIVGGLRQCFGLDLDHETGVRQSGNQQ